MQDTHFVQLRRLKGFLYLGQKQMKQPKFGSQMHPPFLLLLWLVTIASTCSTDFWTLDLRLLRKYKLCYILWSYIGLWLLLMKKELKEDKLLLEQSGCWQPTLISPTLMRSRGQRVSIVKLVDYTRFLVFGQPFWYFYLIYD